MYSGVYARQIQNAPEGRGTGPRGRWVLKLLAVLIVLGFAFAVSMFVFPLVLVLFGIPGLLLLTNFRGARGRITGSRPWARIPWIRDRSPTLAGSALVLWAGTTSGFGVAMYKSSADQQAQQAAESKTAVARVTLVAVRQNATATAGAIAQQTAATRQTAIARTRATAQAKTRETQVAGLKAAHAQATRQVRAMAPGKTATAVAHVTSQAHAHATAVTLANVHAASQAHAHATAVVLANAHATSQARAHATAVTLAHAQATSQAHDDATAVAEANVQATIQAIQNAPYKVIIVGSLPAQETVGIPMQLSIQAQDAGKDIPHLVLDFDGLGSWVIDGVSGCNGTAAPVEGYGNPYDFGPVTNGQTCNITLDLTPNTAGNPTLSSITYANLDSSTGSIDTGASVDNREASVEWHPAINP